MTFRFERDPVWVQWDHGTVTACTDKLAQAVRDAAGDHYVPWGAYVPRVYDPTDAESAYLYLAAIFFTLYGPDNVQVTGDVPDHEPLPEGTVT